MRTLLIIVALALSLPMQSADRRTAIMRKVNADRAAGGGGGGGTVATDNFDSYASFSSLNDAANWVNVSANQIVVYNPFGDGAVYSGVSADARLIRHTATLNTDHYAFGTLQGTSGDCYIGVAVRCQSGADSGYSLVYAGTFDPNLYLQKIIAGSVVNITSAAKVYDPGDKLKLVAVGSGSSTRLTAYEDTGSGWVAVFSSVDPGDYLDGGFAGICGLLVATSTDTTLDDWECGNQ